jgi:hypothetical protein
MSFNHSPICILSLTSIGHHDDNRLLVPDMGSASRIPNRRSLWRSEMEEGMARDVYVFVFAVYRVYYFTCFAQKVRLQTTRLSDELGLT